MKKSIILIAGLFLMSFLPAAAVMPSSQAVHQEMHSQLLANAKSSIDKSVIQEYIKAELETKEQVDPIYGNLSPESVLMIGDLLQEARTHSGKRYRSGGKGPNAFDCSGFTSYVYNQFGYKLDPSSRGQFTEGVKVEKGDLRPGDLVFFTGRRINNTVGHVGIVTSADNENHTFSFIHAATSGGIKIDHSSAPYYKQRYVGARRIINE